MNIYKTPIYAIFGVLAISLFSSSANATVFRIDFYTEMVGAPYTYDGHEYFQRTSATGEFLYNDAVTGAGVFPAGKPVIHLKNEIIRDDGDITEPDYVFEPDTAPQDWLVGTENVGVLSSNGIVTDFSIDVFWMGNPDPLGDFDNPRFKTFTSLPRDLERLSIWYADDGANWVQNSGGITTETAVNWSYSVVPIPASVWLFGSGLLGLIGVARRKKA